MRAAHSKVTGFRELDRKLAILSQGPTRDQKIGALLAGGEVIAAEERRLAPKRSGRLAGSVVVTAEAVGLPRGDVVYLGPTLDGWYGGLVETGTASMAAQPFARPAFNSKADEAASVSVAHLVESVGLK